MVSRYAMSEANYSIWYMLMSITTVYMKSLRELRDHTQRGVARISKISGIIPPYIYIIYICI